MDGKMTITMRKVKGCKNSVKYSNWSEAHDGEVAGTVYLPNDQYASMGSPSQITVQVSAG